MRLAGSMPRATKRPRKETHPRPAPSHSPHRLEEQWYSPQEGDAGAGKEQGKEGDIDASARSRAHRGDDLGAAQVVLGQAAPVDEGGCSTTHGKDSPKGGIDQAAGADRGLLQTPLPIFDGRDRRAGVGGHYVGQGDREANKVNYSYTRVRIQFQEGSGDRQTMAPGGDRPTQEEHRIQARRRLSATSPERCSGGARSDNEFAGNGVRARQDQTQATETNEVHANTRVDGVRVDDGSGCSHHLAGGVRRCAIPGGAAEASQGAAGQDDCRPVVPNVISDATVGHDGRDRINKASSSSDESGMICRGRINKASSPADESCVIGRDEESCVESVWWRHGAIRLSPEPPIVWGVWGGPFTTPPEGKRKKVKQGEPQCSGCVRRDQDIGVLESKLKQEREGASNAANAAHVDAQRKVEQADVWTREASKRATQARKEERKAKKLKEAAEERAAEDAAAARAAQKALEELKSQYARLQQLHGRLERQMEQAKHLNTRLRDTAVPLEVHNRALGQRDKEVATLHGQMEEQLALVADARESVARLEEAAGQEQGDEAEDQTDEPIEGEISRERELLSELRAAIGLEDDRGLPSRTFTGDSGAQYAEAKWRSRSVKHMVAVLTERGGDTNIDLVATALDRLGYLERLVDSPTFARVRQRLAQETMSNLQLHWSSRHAVHIWDRLGLSRSQMETLRHLLSFVYDPVADRYEPIRVWQDPDRPKAFVAAARLACRQKREGCFDEIAQTCDIVVGADGRCERDASKLTSLLYSDFCDAMRTDFSPARPAQPLLFVDGTGGSLGKGTCHSELGSADFTGDCKQSRSTLSPLAQHEGNDHALDLRANMSLSFSSFNAMSTRGDIQVNDRKLPVRPSITADMQGVKSIAGSSLVCHSVWCKCKKGSDAHHAYGTDGEVFLNYAAVCSEIDRVGCEFKSEEFLCNCAHLPLSYHRNDTFTKFKCPDPDCGYQPTEKQFWKDMKRFEGLSSEQQLAERKEHNVLSSHWHQFKWMAPLQHLGMERIGANQLHLIYLNHFKHLFRGTIHDSLSG